MFIMMNMGRLRFYRGLSGLFGNQDLMHVMPRDHFLTLDAPFPLSMNYVKDAQGNIMKEFIHPNKEGYRDPDQQHPQMSGLLAIKYLMTEGHTISFIKCGVILAGSVSDICDGNQKRRIISLLRKYVGQEFSSQILQGSVESVISATSSSSSWASASPTSVVPVIQGPRDGQYSGQAQGPNTWLLYIHLNLNINLRNYNCKGPNLHGQDIALALHLMPSSQTCI